MRVCVRGGGGGGGEGRWRESETTGAGIHMIYFKRITSKYILACILDGNHRTSLYSMVGIEIDEYLPNYTYLLFP